MTVVSHERDAADAELRGDVAIIGMACRFPGAADLPSYWQNILSKVDAVTDPPAEAWDADLFYDPESTANDRVYCKKGGYLGPLAFFDPLAHGVMPLAVKGSEPDQWLALQVATSALRDAGYEMDQIPERHRTAVVLGKGTYLNHGNFNVVQHGTVVDQTLQILRSLHPEYTGRELEQIRDELVQALPPFNADTVPGLIPNIIAGRIANRLDLMGPSYTVDAACASSSIAIDMAVRDLLTHQCDLALAGGSHVVTPVPVMMVFCQLNALSRREQIRPFDRTADGTILGEGIGMVVLKRLEDAQRDGNRIYAVIKGVGIASDGRGLSVMAPRIEGEVLALERAYARAGVSPQSVGLIEAHGTGTPLGDLTEVEALTRVFGERAGGLPWCALGSVKSMIGHLMPAAGIAGVIKSALSLYHKVLPPTLHVTEPNRALDSERSPFYLNTEVRPWIHRHRQTPRRAGVNAFGFGGINAHVILEEAPQTEPAAFESCQQRWDSEVLILSAPTRADLVARGRQLVDYLQAVGAGVALKDLAYTLNTAQSAGGCRLALVASTLLDLQEKLDRVLPRLDDDSAQRIRDIQGIYFFAESLAEDGQLLFLFPGEGSQYLHMLADLSLHFPEVRAQFDLIDRVFASHDRNYVPSDYIFPRPAFTDEEQELAEARLWQMEGAVEAVLIASRALWTLMERLQIRPDAVMGHSTGDYSAMLAAGMIDLADEGAIDRFSQELNQIYQQAAGEGDIRRAVLIAVGADVETVTELIAGIEGPLFVAMDNCPHQVVIVGSERSGAAAMELLGQRGLIYEQLTFDRPYHTPLFATYTERLHAFVARWLNAPPRLPIYSCTTIGRLTGDLERNRQVAIDHWLLPVEFRRTVEQAYADGVRIFVEVGPKGNLTAFVDDILRGKPHLAVPANIKSRSGITQLNHLVALLAAHGVPLQLDYLYAHRAPRRLSLDAAADLAGGHQPPPDRMQLVTGWPAMGLSDAAAAALRPASRRASPAAAEPPAAVALSATPPSRPADQTDAQPMPLRPAVETRNGRGETRAAALSPVSTARVVSAHLQTMDEFLRLQEEVMQAFLTGRVAPAGEPAVSRWAESGTDGAQGVAVSAAAAAPRPQAPLGAERAGTSVPEPAPTLPAAGPAAPPPPEPTPTGGETDRTAAVRQPQPLGIDEIRSSLLRLVSERTGYPVEMLDLNLDLEAHLGIDSIKRVEILGSFQQETGLLQTAEMDTLASYKTLQGLIDFVQQQLGGQAGVEAPLQPTVTPKRVTRPAATEGDFPFLQQIVSLTPGRSLVATYRLDWEEALFLHDHTLGRSISVTDPALRGLPVVPLTMSMEMMAEAAAELMPGRQLVGMRAIHARRWITDEGCGTIIQIAAQRSASAADEVQVAITLVDETGECLGDDSRPVVEGIMLFAEEYPAAPMAGRFDLKAAQPPRWAPEQLYTEVMFHGPLFRGVAEMRRTGADGAEALVTPLAPDGLFRSDPAPKLVTDPVLLDQPGQVVGFWTAEQLESAYVIFPFFLESLELYGPPTQAPRQLTCQARITLSGERQVRSDLALVSPDGEVWARLRGWEDLRFDVPDSFFRFMMAPRESMLSEPAPAALQVWHEAWGMSGRSMRPPTPFLQAHGGLWLRVLAHLVLSRREREQWHALTSPTPRRIQWLLGRVAAKDAVRLHLRHHHGLKLAPADIEIVPDEHGRPQVAGSWLAQLAAAPLISIAHAGELVLAVVAAGGGGGGIGVDVEPVGRLHQDAHGVAFTPEEQALLQTLSGDEEAEWPLRFWCAKEAVAKALGRGLQGRPRALVVRTVDASTGMVHVEIDAQLAREFGWTGESGSIVARTAREGDQIVAAAATRVVRGDAES